MKTLKIRVHKLVYGRKRFKQQKVFYKCQKCCPIQAFIQLSEYNQTCELWVTANEHDHTNASQHLTIECCVHNIQIRINKSSEKVQIRYSKRLKDQN